MRTLLRFMARQAARPMLQCTASAERFGIAETNTWNFFRAHIHNMARTEDVLVWNSDKMWEDVKPFRKFRPPIVRDGWHHADYEGVGQMVAVYHREFIKIVAMRAHCTMSWDRLLDDNVILGTPLVDADQPIASMRATMPEETLNLSVAAGSVDEGVTGGAGEDEGMGVGPAEIAVKSEVSEGAVLKASIGKAKAAAPPMLGGGAVAKASSSGVGVAAKAAAPPIPTPEAVDQGTSGLAKPVRSENAWCEVTGRIGEEKEVVEATISAERMVLRANESDIECMKAAKAIRDFQQTYPMVQDTPACQTLIDMFVSLSSDAPKG